MLNEARVKHMVKLAAYESKNTEETKIHTYEKKDYVRVQVFITSLWVSLSYFLLVFLLGMVYAERLFTELSVGALGLIILGIVVIYLAILVRYILFAQRFYQKKYLMAQRNMKRFARGLEKLEKMYEKEGV